MRAKVPIVLNRKTTEKTLAGYLPGKLDMCLWIQMSKWHAEYYRELIKQVKEAKDAYSFDKSSGVSKDGTYSLIMALIGYINLFLVSPLRAYKSMDNSRFKVIKKLSDNLKHWVQENPHGPRLEGEDISPNASP